MNMGSISLKQKDYAKSLMISFQKSAKMYGKEMKLVKKPSPNMFYEWEHIRYSEKGFFSATMTSLGDTDLQR